MYEVAVALRSAEPELIDAVREVVALAHMPLSVYPLESEPPQASLILDSAVETMAADPSWRRRGPGFAWVGQDVKPETGRSPYFALPRDADRFLTRLRSVCTRRRARVIGVVGARGGAGASSLAIALARSAALAGLSVGLADLDFTRGGLDVLIGIEHEPGLRWADLTAERSGFAPAELTASLPAWCGIRILSADLRSVGDQPHEQVLVALADAHDLLILDLPRDQAHHGALAGRWVDTMVVVASCDVQASAGAQALARALVGLDVHLVVRGPAPAGLEPVDVARACGLPLLATMTPERSLTAAVERGVPPGQSRRGPLMRTARRIVAELDLAS